MKSGRMSGLLQCRIVVALSIVAMLAGCAAKAPSGQAMQGELEGFSLPHEPAGDEALVYVVRPEITGTLVRFNVFVDDTDAESEVGYTRGSQHIYFPVEPGRHAIFSKAENWADIEIDVVAGEIAFLRQHAEMGLIMARNSLSRLNEDEGKYFVKETELGTLLNSN